MDFCPTRYNPGSNPGVGPKHLIRQTLNHKPNAMKFTFAVGYSDGKWEEVEIEAVSLDSARKALRDNHVDYDREPVFMRVIDRDFQA